MADKVKHTKSSKTSKGTADKKQKNPLSTSPITSATDFSNHCDDTSNFGRNASKAPEAMKMPTLHEPTLKRKVDHPENKEVIAYVHSISPIKRNRKNTLDYFNLKLQTAEDVFPSVCFSRTKRSLFLERQETKTAIKLERFNMSKDGNTIFINDMTKVQISINSLTLEMIAWLFDINIKK